MTDAVIIAAIGGVVSIVNAAMMLLIKQRVEGVHKQLNSMRDQENATNRKLGQKEGMIQGAEINQAKTDAKPQDQK